MIETVIPDTGPIISLARIDRLDLLDGFDSQILVTDAVEFELMNGPEDAPDLASIKDWLTHGGNRIRVVETSYMELIRVIRELLLLVPEEERIRIRRRHRIRGAGENSIREIADEVRNGVAQDSSVLVLFEDSRVRKMDFGGHVHLMNTWSFAMALEKIGRIPSARELFDQIEKTGRTLSHIPFERRAQTGVTGEFADSYSLPNETEAGIQD